MRKIFNGVHYPYTKLSKHGCKVCGKKIKARLILIKETIPRLNGQKKESYIKH